MKLQEEVKTKPSVVTAEKHNMDILEAAPADDVDGLRLQLEACRSALRLQSSRSRQLVAAYTTKLREKEAALRDAERNFDTRLASILRALLALEANLRREQRTIKAQLVDKDKIIIDQRRIITSLMKSETSSNDESSQNSSLNSSSNSSEIITVQQTIKIDSKITIDKKEEIINENNEYLSNITKDHFTKNPVVKPVKPPKPPKPNVHTPYKPILKFSVARQTAIKKDGNSRSLPELSYVQQRAKRATNEVCLLLAPSRNAPSTHHMHPPEQKENVTTPPPVVTQNNKLTSAHRVSRMVQRFEPRANARSLSCTALHSRLLSHVSEASDVDVESSSETQPSREGTPVNNENEENLRRQSDENEENLMSHSDENAELYSLSSNDDKYQLNENTIEKTEYLDTLSGNFDEFHLDSENSDEHDDDIVNRKDGDGAENLIPQNQPVNNNNNKVASSYEGFLEATGLSQKSILTPSRLASVTNNSHRSVLKPRDVKFRSKANRCFNTGTVKYWSGPYL